MITDNPALEAFFNKLTFFKIFNAIYFIWLLAELIFFSIVTASITCSQLSSIFISWTISYACELSVPVFAFIVMIYLKWFRGMYAVLIINCVYKLAVIVTAIVLTGKHVGMCYLTPSMRVVIIVNNVIQIGMLTIQYFIVRRIRRASREVKVNKIITSKTFAADH